VPRYRLWGILIAQCAQGFLMLGFGVISFHGFVTRSNPLAWNRDDFKRLTRYGSKASVVGFLQLATEPLIRLLASHFGGLASVTLIELATRMIVAVRGLVMSVGQLLVPAFARASVKDQVETAKLYTSARQVFVLVTVPVLSCLMCVAPLLERIMLVKPTLEFLPMVWMLSLGWGVNIITAPAFFLLTGRRRLRPLFWNRLLMLITVLIFGAVGGQFLGILGVTFGVAVGLISASLIVFRAAREFEPEGGLGAGFGLRFSMLALPVLAAATTVSFLFVADRGYSFIVLALVTVLGLLATLGVTLLIMPTNLLARR
jgi:O-antigen/teichoic acid export membrane protein